MVNEYEDIIQPPEQFRDAYKPIPPPRIGKWKNVKPKPIPRKSVKQMVDEFESLIIPPPEQFRDKYRLIPKPRTDRPLQIRENQNAQRPPKPQRSPPPKNELEDPIIPPLQFRDNKPLQEPVPSPMIKNRAPKILKLDQALNPSFTKPFGTYTFYQGGGGGGRAEPPSYLKNRCPMNLKFCRVSETPLKVSEMLKLFT